MAAFTQLDPVGSRFTDGTYGVFCAANDLDSAVAETAYHRGRFMRTTGEDRMELTMRVYLVDLAALHDLRGRMVEYPLVYRSDDYSAGQYLAAEMHKDGSNGIAYDSVRRQGGECAAVFRPRVLPIARQERHLCYVWDGRQIVSVYEKRELGSGVTGS